MCLAIPARIIDIDTSSDMATVSLGGIEKQVSLALVDEVQIDDYVLVHVGYALNKISQSEAEKTLTIFAEAGMLDSEQAVAAEEAS